MAPRIKFIAHGCAELRQGKNRAELHHWEASIVLAAMCRPWLSIDEICDIIWPGYTTRPVVLRRGVDTRLCSLRRITRIFGFEISIGLGQKYQLKMLGV